VIGSALPVAVAANWLAGAWNQNAAMRVLSPTTVRLEEIALRWTRARNSRDAVRPYLGIAHMEGVRYSHAI